MGSENIRTYRDLEVWKRSFKLALAIYRLTQSFPDREKFGLVSQMRRRSISIPSNIAEGFAGNSQKEFARFLRIAGGSLFELQTQSLISAELGYLTTEDAASLDDEANQLERMLASLISKVSRSRHNDSKK